MDSERLLQLIESNIELCEQGQGYVSPNPCVGAIIFDKNFNVLAMGYHRQYGQSHAEMDALDQIKDKNLLHGATVFVTLEPCAHEGRTPSCAKTLSQYPIKAVMALIKDPNPLVKGKGFKILNERGIKTLFLQDLASDLTAKEIIPALGEIQKSFKLKNKLNKLIQRYQDLNRKFLYAIQQDVPYITLKWAQSLNGVIGSNGALRLLITGKEAMRTNHFFRATHDATLVGVNTLMNDNSRLNIRHGRIDVENKVIIVDPELKSLDERNNLDLFKVHKAEKIFLLASETKRKMQKPEGINILFVPMGPDGKLDLEFAMMILRKEYNIQSVFVEGGARILKSFYDQELFNEINVLLSPRFLNGKKSLISFIGLFKNRSLKLKTKLLERDVWFRFVKN